MLGSPSRRRAPKRTPARRQPTPQLTRGNMQVRVVTFAFIVAVIFLVLGARLWYLQVLAGSSYSLTAQQTQTREVKIPAQRGVIYDRNMKVLASNVPGLNVTVVPSKISRQKVAELCRIVGADPKTVLKRYDEAIKLNPYSAMLVKENASRDDVTYVSERTYEFPGVFINDDWIRRYPDGPLAAHVIGYTGAITQDELKMSRFKGLSNDAVVGQSGIEYQYEKLLRGKAGSRNYNVDALGRVVAVRNANGSRADGQPDVAPESLPPNSITEPVPGKSLVLTLDTNLQKAAELELDGAIARAQQEGYSGRGGAVIAMDPRNGQILAMASRPTFDPQLFVGGINGPKELQEYKYLNSPEANSPFTNRAIDGAFPGASTFKIFTGLAGFFYGVINPATTYTDTGGCWSPAGSSGCWQSWREFDGTGTTHGTQDYSQAVTDSNDKFFYQVADWLWQSTNNVDLLPNFYKRFGFGSLTGIDLPGESPGRIPTKEWFDWYKKQTGSTDPRPFGIADWINMAIGQGDVLVSPIQMAVAYSAIENGGTLVKPHLAKDILQQPNNRVEKVVSPKPQGKVNISPQARQALLQGLRGVTGPNGTAAAAFTNSKLTILGKSGTGERAGSDPVNWFAGWAAGQKRPLVVVVMVDGSGVSEATCAPAVRGVLEDYYGIKKETPETATGVVTNVGANGR